MVRSSDKDRCIETAMGVAAALYPGQRIPVHTYSNHWEDLLLKPNSVLCVKADKEERRDKAILHQRLNEEYEEFFQFLSEKTGMPVDMSNVKDLYNTLFREVCFKLEQRLMVEFRYQMSCHSLTGSGKLCLTTEQSSSK